MLVPFNTLPDTSKVWIYQASRLMTDEEAVLIHSGSEKFIESWTAHQAGLKAGVSVLYNTFVVFAVDESYNDASGCSIDKKVHFVKSIEQQTGINFFDRMQVAYKKNNLEVSIVPLSQINNELHEGNLKFDTIVFNNLVTNIHAFKTSWQLYLKDSWIMNFVDKSTV